MYTHINIYMLYILLILLSPLALLSIHTILTHWSHTEGLFTMLYLCVFLSILLGWTLTDVLDINFFWHP